MQKIPLVLQVKMWIPEKILSLKKHGTNTNLDKKGLSLQKKLGSNKFFGTNKPHIDLGTTFTLIKV